MVVHGHNPYAVVPAQVTAALADPSQATILAPGIVELGQQAEAAGGILGRINHPDLSTVYPPVTQGAFALAHLAKPWSLGAWRLLLLGFDLVTVALLLKLLVRLNLPVTWVVLYWWNPLVLKEVFNSGHMETVILPFLLGGVLLALHRRFVWAALLITLGAGAKLWPVILLPILLAPIAREPKKLAPALAVVLALGLLMLIPIYTGGIDDRSGFLNYGRTWEMNDSAYMLILWGVKGVSHLAIASPTSQLTDELQSAFVMEHMITRGLVALGLVVIVILLARGKRRGDESVIRACMWAVAALFLLSPTQFPWYFIWVLPFAVIDRRWSLLILVALLPLYNLRFLFKDIEAGSVAEIMWFFGHWLGIARPEPKHIFDYGIVFLEFLPVWALLVWGLRRRSLQTHAT